MNKHEEQEVMEYLRTKPGSTARDVAREVFGGTGDTRTTERTRAHRILRALELQGKVVGSVDEDDASTARRWRVRKDDELVV